MPRTTSSAWDCVYELDPAVWGTNAMLRKPATSGVQFISLGSAPHCSRVMIRGRRVKASAAEGANGPPGPPTATGPTSPGPVLGPPAVPELLMNRTLTFPTTAPFGRFIENRRHRASPVQT